MDARLVSIATSALRAETNGDKSLQEQLRSALADGFSPEDIARLLRNIAYNAEKDSDALRATELAAKLMGVSEDRAAIPVIRIMIQGETMNSIFLPPSSSNLIESPAPEGSKGVWEGSTGGD